MIDKTNLIDEEIDLEEVDEDKDEFYDLSADLVISKESDAFLKSLFAGKKGEWQRILSLCKEIPEFIERVNAFEEVTDAHLFAVWMDYPEVESGFCTVFTFADTLLWTWAATYNKAYFDERINTAAK